VSGFRKPFSVDFFLDYLMQPLTKKGQTLHDLMAGTLVGKYSSWQNRRQLVRHHSI
jgi:hypothetical protein